MNRALITIVATYLFVFSSLVLGAPLCSDVLRELLPCLNYINHTQNNPSNDCCTGVHELMPYSNSRDDRVAICKCLMSYAPEVGMVDFNLIPTLPGKCGVSVQLPPVSINMNCSRI